MRKMENEDAGAHGDSRSPGHGAVGGLEKLLRVVRSPLVISRAASPARGLCNRSRADLKTMKLHLLPILVAISATAAFAEQKSAGDSYAPLVREIMQFFQTGIPLVKLSDVFAAAR